MKNNFFSKFSLRTKLFLGFVLFGFFIIITNNTLLLYSNQKHSIEEIVNQASEEFEYHENYFLETIDTYSSIINSINNDEQFQKAIIKNNKKNIESIFKVIISTSKHYRQLRWIDNDGMELVRVNYDGNTPASIIPQNKLQNRYNRYYVQQLNNLNQGELWYSKFDLNKEHNKIQQPKIAILRVGIPIYINNKRKGSLLLNIDVGYFLSFLSRNTLYNIYLIDQDGNFILNNIHHLNLSRYSSNKKEAKNYFKQSYSEIIDNQYFYGNNFYAKKLRFYNDDKITMILEVKKNLISIQFKQLINESILTILIMMVLSFLFAYLFSYFTAKIGEDIKKSKELKNFNAQLSRRVREEIAKNKNKDALLKEQSRLAIMGEMINMIAHQWRQPLSAIRAKTTLILMKQELGMVDDQLIEENLKGINNSITFLTTTINDFRDFYSNNKVKEIVFLSSVSDKVLSLIEPRIKANSINIIKEQEIEEFYKQVEIYPNELQQVLLNIFNNAMDELIAKQIANPTIKINITDKDEGLEIQISDNAGGVPTHIVNKIFDPYFSTKSKNGTGLGLYMSKMIMHDSLGGKLNVTNGDDGAIFSIYLPYAT